MVTIELSRRGWNTHYLQYDPDKWVISFVPEGNTLTVNGCTLDMSRTSSYGPWHEAGIRRAPLPEHLPAHELVIWD